MKLQSDTMSLIARMMPASDLLIPGIRLSLCKNNSKATC